MYKGAFGADVNGLTEDCSYVTIITSREQAFFVSIYDDF